jgi:hypothetical protein
MPFKRGVPSPAALTSPRASDTITQGNTTMTLTLNLTPAEEQQLLARAFETGPEADAFIANIVRQTLAAPIADDEFDMPAPGESAYDALKDYIGLFGGGEETNWSENTGEKFTDYVAEKHRQDRL